MENHTWSVDLVRAEPSRPHKYALRRRPLSFNMQYKGRTFMNRKELWVAQNLGWLCDQIDANCPVAQS